MTRQEKLKEIGELKLSEYSLKIVIPCPHNFYNNKDDIFEKIIDWEIVNKNDDKAFGSYNIKTYIYDNVVPKLNDTNKNEFLDKNKTLILKKELKDKFCIENFTFIIPEILLWIFDEHIAFFSLEIKLEKFNGFPINEINEFHRLIREYKFLNINFVDNEYKISKRTDYKETYEFIDYLLGLTKIDNKSFLNISLNDCKFKSEKDELNEKYHIYNSTTNGKLLIGMQIEKSQFSDGKEIIELQENEITSSSKNINILDEATYLIATCSSLNQPKNLIQSDSYIYDSLTTNKFSLWKYSLGVILHDNTVFLGLNNDEGNVIRNVNNSFYFIYMLNLYIYNQIRYLEHMIIDSSFESLEIEHYFEQLQKLKNQFISDDVGIKFQENELNRVFIKSYKTNELLSQVTTNLLQTKEISKNNRNLIFAILTYPLINNLDLIKNNIFLTLFLFLIGLFILIKRKKIIRFLYKIDFKKIKRFSNKIDLRKKFR